MTVRSLFQNQQDTSAFSQQQFNRLSLTPSQSTIQTPQAPKVNGFLSSAGPVLGGLAASRQIAPGTDTTSALVGIASATATGAASGAMVGGPLGAVVGGGVGLLSSSINSWLSIRAQNKRKKEIAKLTKEVEEKNARKDAQNRRDSLMKFRFNRKDIEDTKAINAFTTKRQLLMDMFNNSQSLKDRFLQTGIT